MLATDLRTCDEESETHFCSDMMCFTMLLMPTIALGRPDDFQYNRAHTLFWVVRSTQLSRMQRLERLADELFALVRSRLERHLAKVMEDVAVEAATAALRRIEPRRARLRRVSECENDGVEETSSHTV